MAEISSTTTLQPIVPPTAPPPEMSLDNTGVAWVIGSGLLLVFTGMLFKRCSHRLHGRHRVRRIRRDVRDNKIDPETMAYQLAGLLRRYFRLNRLEKGRPPKGISEQSWLELIIELETLRYKPRKSVDPVEFEPMFVTLARWFRC